ncbi:hypothetical protein D1007_43498 [Hordeum vulgare]|nr:hypothetical protein D1007_43498 [Hordeum vulgare]
MRKTDLTVVYTNDPFMVEDSVNTMEELVTKDGKYKVGGFDLAYTGSDVKHDQKVVVTQFDNNSDYRFAMVDTANDPKMLNTSGLSYQKLVDISDHYKIWGGNKDMDSHVDLAEAIIDPYYGGTKFECDKNKPSWHRASVKKLDKHNNETAAKEAYTCYKMFRRIADMRNCLLPIYVEGSSHKDSGGGKHHRK